VSIDDRKALKSKTKKGQWHTMSLPLFYLVVFVLFRGLLYKWLLC
jgi:hypothetical protein